MACRDASPYFTTQVRENSTCGDQLTEEVANKLHFLTPKDYPSLFSGVSKAATAYALAHDQQGTQVSPAAVYVVRLQKMHGSFGCSFFPTFPSLVDSDKTTRAHDTTRRDATLVL